MACSIRKAIIDDGMNAELVETALFDGILEIPIIAPPQETIVPTGMIPFSQRNKSTDFSETVVFYEHDTKFREILISSSNFVQDLRRFKGGLVTPDCSVYWDMPLIAQITNVYRNHALGHFFQHQGIRVYPNVRWGDERSYTTKYFPEKFAFLGVPKHSIVSVGTYGCISSKEALYHMEAGFESMLETLQPIVVLIYGSLPQKLLNRFAKETCLICYPDWITLKKGGKSNGHN